jgi:hypothetical protein
MELFSFGSKPERPEESFGVFLRLPTEANDKGQRLRRSIGSPRITIGSLSFVGHVACSGSELGTPQCLTSEQFTHGQSVPNIPPYAAS